jgi:hypothetical protein
MLTTLFWILVGLVGGLVSLLIIWLSLRAIGRLILSPPPPGYAPHLRITGTPGTIVPQGTEVGFDAAPEGGWFTAKEAVIGPQGWAGVKLERKT